MVERRGKRPKVARGFPREDQLVNAEHHHPEQGGTVLEPVSQLRAAWAGADADTGRPGSVSMTSACVSVKTSAPAWFVGSHKHSTRQPQRNQARSFRGYEKAGMTAADWSNNRG